MAVGGLGLSTAKGAGRIQGTNLTCQLAALAKSKVQLQGAGIYSNGFCTFLKIPGQMLLS